MKGDKKGELTLKPSYMKLTRKIEKQRLVRMELDNSREEERRNSIANKSLGSVFRIKTEASQICRSKKQYFSLAKTHSQNGSTQKEYDIPKGCTPYQARKIAERSKTTKTITRILEKSRVGSRLDNSQDSCLVVKEIPTGPKWQEQKQIDIRDTDTTVKGDQMLSLLRKSNRNYNQPTSTLLNSWIFACNQELKSRNIKEQLANKKLVLKELWKLKNNVGNDAANGLKLDQIQQLKSLYQQKMKDKNDVRYRKARMFQNRIQELLPRQNSIHSKNNKNSTNHHHYPTQPAFKVKPCTLQSSAAFRSGTKTIHCSSSDTKMDVIRSSIVKGSPRKVNRSCKRFKAEEPLTKDVCGWEYFNDFSQRENLF